MLFFKDTTTLKKSDLLNKMSDFHCHLLPGVDDGIKVIEDTLKILSYYESLGISTVWMTPHVMEDIPNTTEKLKERFHYVLTQYNGPIKLHLAAEYMMDNEFSNRIDKKDFLPLGEDQDQVLVETSTFNGPRHMEDIFNRIKSAGFFPVLAHPERYTYMKKEDYLKWKNQDIKFQLNMPSLHGLYGKNEKEKAEWMLLNDMYDYYGTDTHTTRHIANTDLPFAEFEFKKKLLPHLEELIEKAI